MIDYHALKNRRFADVVQSYTARDTMLYALGLGLGRDPLDERDLRHVYEKNLVALPTMAVVLGSPGFWMKEPDSGIDWVKVLHGEQAVQLHRPLPAAATIVGKLRITALIDKGAGRGALVVAEREVRDAASGVLYATVRQVTFARGDGGFSEVEGNGPKGGDAPPPALPAAPESDPDQSVDCETSLRAALIYRLSGDYNPLHVEPAVACAAGFARPILHGLASYGVAGLAILRECCGSDPARLKSLSLRFSSPVYPGETLRTELWLEPGRVRFRARAMGHPLLDEAQCKPGRVVLSNGVAEIA